MSVWFLLPTHTDDDGYYCLFLFCSPVLHAYVAAVRLLL